MHTLLQQHLIRLSQAPLLPDAHKDYLSGLKQSGFYPHVIYDIGCCVLHWTLFVQELWPDATIVLFDAFDKAEFLYRNYKYHIGVLSDVDHRVVRFYQNDIYPGGNSYYREIGFKISLFPENEFRTCVARSLDSVVKERGFPLPDLVKLDVQGSEKDILTGGQQTIAGAKRLIVEMQHVHYNDGAPLAEETMPWIESLGWTCDAQRFSSSPVDADYGFVKIM